MIIVKFTKIALCIVMIESTVILHSSIKNKKMVLYITIAMLLCLTAK